MSTVKGRITMDQQVKNTQVWLNQTYGSVDGWVSVDENGLTGWDTVYGLRMGLQHELGISPVASGFGPVTTAAFIDQIGQIDASTTSQNLVKLVSGSLWCKGFAGTGFDGTVAFSDVSASVAAVRADLGLSTGTVVIDVKLMASLLSMDAYTTLSLQGGTDNQRGCGAVVERHVFGAGELCSGAL